MIEPRDIENALRRYQERYRYLDVLAADVVGLERARKVGRQYRLPEHPMQFKRVGNDVLRFSLVAAPLEQLGPAAAGAAFGAALGANSETEGGTLAGLMLGMLVGAVVGESVQMNRVMALRFEPHAGSWGVYDGPLLNAAKSRLAPAT